MRCMRVLAIPVLSCAVLGFAVMPAGAQPRISDLELAKSLKAGGLVVVMRHTAADPDKGDTDPLNFRNVLAQQPLTDGGKSAAKAFGGWLKLIGAEFAEAITSRYNRAFQTAVLAGFNAKDVKASADVTEGSLVASPNENRRRAAALKKLTATPPPPGKNRLIVTHRVNIMNAFGKEWFDVKEGEASVFKADGTSYSLLARVPIDDWGRIAQSVKP